MADVTGVFKADFSSFFDAVEQSQVKLKGLEADSSKVESNLSRMANAFSGQKIIQDATLMAEVFERAGGASSFTEKELARMGATGAEAVEKLKALGQDIPDGIQKIADQSKSAETATESWGAAIGKVAAGYLSMQGLEKIWGFAREIMGDADALEDLSAQTRINTTDLQNLGVVVQDFGVDMDQMGRAIFGLSKRIASGDDSVNDALKQMGLSIEAVKNLNPIDMFLKIMDAAGQMNSQFKDTAMVTLFGDKIGQVMAGATKDIRGAYDEQVKLNQAIGPDAVKALADADRAMETTWTRMKAWAGTKIFGPLAEDINTLVDNDKLNPWSLLAATYLDRVATSVGASATRVQDLKNAGNELNPVLLDNKAHVNDLIRGYDGLSPAIANTAGETAKLREEQKRLQDQRFNPAETLSGFEHATETMKAFQPVVDETIRKRDEAAAKNAEDSAKELQLTAAKETGARGYMKAVGEFVTQQKAQEAQNKALIDQQAAFNKENDAAIAKLNDVGAAHTAAGAAATTATAATTAGYQAATTVIQMSGDAIKEWTNLMRYSAQVNAILGEGHLFTTQSQRDRIADLPSFASGVENFEGGLAKVHGGEVLANLPPGTSVYPRGQGFGSTVNNTFNLVDSESNLARRVAELIMRNVRAGAQMGTA